MSVKDDLIGAKGGSGASFRNRPDNLRSTDTFEALIGLCSGRIRGLAPGGLKNLFVDDVPIEDGSGNTTLKDFNAVLFNGDPAILQPITLQLGGSSGAQTVNLPINNPNQNGTPGEWRYATVPQAGVDYIDIRLVVQSLFRQDKNGIYDETASLEVELQPSGSSQWINPLQSVSAPTYNQNGIKLSTGYSLYALEDNWADSNTWYDPAPGLLRITGKTTQPYVKELRVAVPNTGNYANKTWQIRIRLRERDSYTQDQNQESRSITFESVAGVSMSPIGNREEWRGLAYLQINGKASDQLTGVPTITGVYDFSEVRVPPASVWDAETRVYTGATWDGATEEIKWTQCPAFQIKDLVEDAVSGISGLTPGSTMNKWDVLEASKWYAQQVPNGKGGTHPRYSMNYILDSALSVNDLMQYVAGAVGSYAWDEGDGNWRLVVEKPENATALFTKEAIVGEFNYSNTDIDGRLNDIIGVFRNEERGYEEDRVRVFDQDHIDNYGRRASSIALVGCTNRQEALRRVKIRQLASLKETRQVTFTTNRQGNLVQPFSVVLIADGDLASDSSLRTTGRLVGISSSELNVRDSLRLEVGVTYKIHLTVPNPEYNPNSTAQPGSADWRKPTITITRNVTNTASQRGDVTSIKIDSPLPANTPANAQVALEAVGLPTLPKQYRVVDVEPQNEELVTITAIEIYTNKWNESDNVNEDEILAQRPNKVIPAPLTPTDGQMFSVKTYQAEFQIKRVLTVRWDRPGSIWIDGFKVEYNLNNGPWVTLAEKTQDSYVELQQPQNGDYSFRITTLDRRGGVSQPLVGAYTLADTAEDYAPTQKVGPLADRPSVGSREGDKYTTNDQNPNLTYIWSNGQWIEESNFVETADQIKYIDPVTGQPTIPVQDLKPAQPGADVTGDHTSKDTNAVGGRPAIDVNAQIDKTVKDLADAKTSLLADIADARQDFNGAVTQVQQAADQAKSEAATARTEAAGARGDAATAYTQASTARTEAGQVKTDLASEVARAKGAEGTLTTKVEQAQGRADQAYSAVSTETTNRVDGDAALANRLNTVESRSTSSRGLTPNGDFINGRVDWNGEFTFIPNASNIGYTAISVKGVYNYLGATKLTKVTDLNRGLRLHAVYRIVGGDSLTYVGVECFDNKGEYLGNIYGLATTHSPGTYVVDHLLTGVLNVGPPVFVMSDKLIAGTLYVRPIFLANYPNNGNTNPDSYTEVSEFWLEDVGSVQITNARISTEETTRANADSALANRLTTVESRVGGHNSADIVARISTEETTRANADGALANRTSKVESSIGGLQDASNNDNFDNGLVTWLNTGDARVVAQDYGRRSVLTTTAGVRYDQITGRKIYVTSYDQVFNLSASWRCAAATGRYFFGALFFDQNDNVVAARDGSGNYPLGPNMFLDSSIHGWVDRQAKISKSFSHNSEYGGSCNIPASTVYFRPVMFLNYEPTAGSVTQVDYFTVEDVTEVNKVNARVTDEATTRASQDSALAARAGSLEATRVYHRSLLTSNDLSEEGRKNYNSEAPNAEVNVVESGHGSVGWAWKTRNASFWYLNNNREITKQVGRRIRATTWFYVNSPNVRPRIYWSDNNAAYSNSRYRGEGETGTGTINGGNTIGLTGFWAKMVSEITITNDWQDRIYAVANIDPVNNASRLDGDTYLSGMIIEDITEVASVGARVSDEATARANQDSALANRIAITEAQISGAQDSVLAARIRDEATTRSSQDGALANRISTTEAKLTRTPDIFRIKASGNSASNSPFGQTTDVYRPDGSRINIGRSYGVLAFDMNTNNLNYAETFDVYGNPQRAQDMANVLVNMQPGRTVIVVSNDEPRQNKDQFGLGNAMAGIGAGEKFFSPNFASRSVYVLVGRGRAGRGGGVEFYKGNGDNDIDAFLDIPVPMLEGRAVLGSDGGASVVRAGLTDEQTVRANQDSALANRISETETNFILLNNGLAIANGRITDEQTTRSNADGALASRVSVTEASSQVFRSVLPIDYDMEISKAPSDYWTQNVNGQPRLDSRVAKTDAWEGGGYLYWGVAESMTVFSVNTIPVDVNRKYRISTDIGAYKTGNTGRSSIFYVGFVGLDAHGNVVDHAPHGTYRYAAVAYARIFDGSRAQFSNIVAGEGNDSGVKFPPGTKQIRLVIIMNYENADIASYVNYVRFEDISEVEKANARISDEAVTRANQDGALAGRISTVESRVGGHNSADIVARLGTEETTRANQDGALAGRISTTEAQLNGSQDSVIAARIRDEATARSNQDGALAGRISTTETQLTRVPEIFRIQAAGNIANNSPFGKGSRIYRPDGTWIGIGRSYGVIAFDMNSNSINYAETFDVYGDVQRAQHMANVLINMEPGRTVIVISNDEPATNRNQYGLFDAMATVGAGEKFFTPNFAGWSAYVLVGRGKAGRGGGTEFYKGDYAQDPNAFLDLNIPFLNGRATLGSDGGASIVRAAVTDEATTRANQDGALAGRISTTESQLNGSQDSVIAARIRDEATTRSNQDGALSGRISSTEAQLNGSQDSTLAARVRSEETARVNADGALGGRIDIVESKANGATSTASVALSTAQDAQTRLGQARVRLKADAGNGRAQMDLYSDSYGNVGVDIVGDVRILSPNALPDGSVGPGKLSVGELSSITAKIGLLRTATSGQRTEYDNNGMRVYNSNGVLVYQNGIY